MGNFATELYRDWLDAFASISTPAISRDTAARVLAVTYVHGNNEALTHNDKFILEIKHIQNMYGIQGPTEYRDRPDAEIVPLIQQYIRELEQYQTDHAHDKAEGEAIFHTHAPQWAHDLFKKRYNIKLIN